MYNFRKNMLILRRKHSLLLVLIFVFSFLGLDAYGQYRVSNNVFHHIGVVGGLGYGILKDKNPEVSSVGNVCGLFGVEYEMRVNGFWLAFGPEFQYLSGKTLFNTTGTDVMILDTYGVEAIYHYDFDKGEDFQRIIYVNLPITIGYYYRGFYLGVGVKCGYGLYGSENTNLRYTTTGTYEDYIDDFQQMMNHSYGTYSSKVSRELQNTYKVSVLGEFGYDVLSWYRNQYRSITSGFKISLCIEYGLNNIIRGTYDTPLYIFNNQNAAELQLNPYYSSRAGDAHKINPFYAGVKLTWLWCVKTKTCKCYENWQYFNKRYKNMVR